MNFRKLRLRGDDGVVGSDDDFCIVSARGRATAIGPTMSASPRAGNFPVLSSISGTITLVTGFSSTALVDVKSSMIVSPSLSRARVGANTVDKVSL